MFKGSKIRLTAIRKEDLPTYQQWASEESFGRFYTSSPIREESEKNANQLIDDHSDRSYRFAIRPLTTEDFLGVCAIEEIEWYIVLVGLRLLLVQIFKAKDLARTPCNWW